MTIRRIAKALLVLALVAAAHCPGQTPALVRTSPIVVEEPGLVSGSQFGIDATQFSASNGSDFLVAWGTNSAPGFIKAARITASGALLDSSGLFVTSSNNFSYFPKHFQLVASGNDYLFVYDAPRVLTGFATRYATPPALSIVTKEGSVMGSPGIVLLMDFIRPFASPLTAAANPSRSIVVWMEDTLTPGDPEITYSIVDCFGWSSRPLPLAKSSGYDVRLSAGTCGDGFLVGWTDFSGLKVARVDAVGRLLDLEGISVSSSRGAAQLVGDGIEYLIAWNSGAAIEARRLSTQGEFVDTESVTLMAGVTGYWRLFPKARGWVVAAKSGQDVISRTVVPHAHGLSFEQAQINVPDMSDRCAVARNNEGKLLLSWNDNTNVCYRIWLPPSQLAETTAIRSGTPQFSPLVTRTGSGYALFWEDPPTRYPSTVSTQFKRLVFPGAVPNEKSTPLVTRASQPAVAGSVGNSLLYAYPASSGIRGMIIPMDNAGAAPTPFQLATGGVTDLGVTGHLTNFVLSWSSGSAFAQRISPEAGVGPMVSLPKNNLRIASDGKLLLAAFADSSGILFASNLDEDTLAISRPVQLGSGAKPALAAKNGRALIVFENKPLYPSLLTAIRLEGTNWIGKTNIDLLSLRYTNNFTVAASDHGFLVFGKESRSFTAGNLPEPRTYAFYIDAASGSVVSNIVSNAGDIFGDFALAGGESDFLLAYSSARDGLRIVTQWIMPIDPKNGS